MSVDAVCACVCHARVCHGQAHMLVCAMDTHTHTPAPPNPKHYPPTSHTRTRELLLERIVAGGITINALNIHSVVQALPFGGVGNSGMGAYHGIDGFRNFTHKKSIYVAKRNYLIPNLLPPFSKFDLRMIDMALKDPPPFQLIGYVILGLLFLYICYLNSITY